MADHPHSPADAPTPAMPSQQSAQQLAAAACAQLAAALPPAEMQHIKDVQQATLTSLRTTRTAMATHRHELESEALRLQGVVRAQSGGLLGVRQDMDQLYNQLKLLRGVLQAAGVTVQEVAEEEE